MRCDNTIHMAFYLAFCLLNTAFSDITASFLLPDVPGQVWKKVGYLNMSNQTQQCPDSWKSISSPVASCGKKDSGPCDSVNISTNGSVVIRWDRLMLSLVSLDWDGIWK